MYCKLTKMDSFYDEPRSAPAPLAFKQVFTKPTVSSPSIIFNSNQQVGPSTSTNNPYSCEFWGQNRDRSTYSNPYTNFMTNGDNICGQKLSNNNSFRKQVRFDNRSPLHAPAAVKRADVHQFSPRSSDFLGYSHKNMDPKKYVRNLVPSMPFEEIYMANIPSRNLDLSIIESNRPYFNDSGSDIENLNPLYANAGAISKPESLNQRNCNRRVLEGLNTNTIRNNAMGDKIANKNSNNPINLDDEVVDLYNYKYENFAQKSGLQLKCDYNTIMEQQNSSNTNPIAHKVDQSIQTQETAVCLAESKDSEEPTVKDLLQIMKQQNEQLLLLQKQVAMLIENQEKREKIEAPPTLKKIAAPPPQDDPQILPPKHPTNAPRPFFQNPNKYSIDVMTSFEVSIRPQTKSNTLKFFKEQINQEPKIQEVTESIESNFTNNKKNSDLSMALNEPLKVPEQSHSPDNSIHVEMQDYSSESEDESPANVGWTLYDNIVGQVNQLLKKTSENKIRADKKFNPLQAVKEATINHLKTMGINVPTENLDVNSGCDSSSSSNSSYSPTEVSFAVKQLLMKYMPDEQLAKVASENSQGNFGNRRPDFSFATLQYMQKYNLLAKDIKTTPAQGQLCSPVKANANKILNITALKQQPKLM